MEWTPDLSVGVEAIDNQHKELIRRMNVFFQSMEGDDKQKVLDMLGFLGEYVVAHFRDEEALQVRYNYPGYADHRKMHQEFMKSVGVMTEDIKNKGFTVASKAMVGMTLTNWLTLHIRRADKAVGDYIRSRA
jgi:hemerythrin